MSAGDTIAQTLAGRGLEPQAVLRLAAYGELVLAANRTTNLTAARSPQAFAEQILDSLSLRADVDGPLIDLGSGAGLPGLPLAIVTMVSVTLVDAAKKKANFLAAALQELGIVGQAINRRAETLGNDSAFREQFRCATARAVATAPAVAELAVPFLQIGGRAFLQRGALDEVERRAVSDAAPMLGAKFCEERLLDGQLRILVLEKLRPTPARFPRRDGVPEKRPLCLISRSA